MNPYQRYMETSLLSASPLELVVELYRGALSAIQSARSYNSTGDPIARGRMVNKAMDIVTELVVFLDDSELGGKLKELYGYMQHRLLEAHATQTDSIFAEVSNLLTTLLEAWQKIASPQV